MKIVCACLALLIAITCTGCSVANAPEPERLPEATVLSGAVPPIPDKLKLDADSVPLLRVYDTKAKEVREMNAERYVEGVLAGEMRSDWPEEALKAQAILARTFVMQFVSEKESRYDGADISTDVSEAQAYNDEKINGRIRTAVSETRGLVLTSDGKLIHAWFHAHAGGKTELPSVGLDYRDGDPSYTGVVDSPESEVAPESVKHWTASFSAETVGKACADAGVSTGTVESIEIQSRGESGRVKTFLINGKAVSAPALRINLDASKLKSTLIESVELQGGEVVFKGSGYGHGVGMSQWGAYGLAEQGKTAEEILEHYFHNTEIVPMWN